MSVQPIVYIVDDDTEVLASFAALLDAAGYRCETYASGGAFLATAQGSALSCAVIDVRMPDMDGLSLLDELTRRRAHMRVIVMTGFGDVPLAVNAMKKGAVDFIEKPCRFADLKPAIDRALAMATGDLARRPGEDEARRFARLTQREREVFDLLVLGDANKAVARKLGISARTVEIHRARVMEKLQAKSLPDLVRLSLALYYK